MTYKTIASVVLLIFIAAIVTIGQARRQTVMPEDRAKQRQVMEVYRQLTEATLRNDVETVDHLTADDYIALGPNENRLGNKASTLSTMETGGITYSNYRDIGLTVRIEGDKGIVSGQTIVTFRRDRQGFTMRYRFSDVFIQRDGEWKIVLSRMTKLISLSLAK